jgi:aminocarboxymuconate-semialdehyde decarboxylase
VPSLCGPPIENFAPPDLARLANDEQAALAAKHRGRFDGFVAALPMHDPDAAVAEADRAVTQLGAAGVQVYANVNGRPLDAPEFLPLFERMAQLNRPIWLHPALGMEHADYPGETASKYELWWALGWPYETSKAMYRLVFAGVFDRWPNLKIIAHHGGGLIPMIEGRLDAGMKACGTRTPPEMREKDRTPLRGKPLASFKRFHADTATFGSAAAIECALGFFGAERMLFATDMPFYDIAGTIEAVRQVERPNAEQAAVLAGNFKRLV